MDSISMVKYIAANKTGSTIYSSGLSRSGSHQAWVSLPGTSKEISAIQSLFEKNKIHSSASYTQQKATEEQFKSLSGNAPTVLHLATHGFFLPGPEKKKREGLQTDNRNAFALSDDPLLRSGIVLSGANRVWSGRPPIEGRGRWNSNGL
ncbi:MAG: CHAT domain-containing protein [Bacteroidota bacterium]